LGASLKKMPTTKEGFKRTAENATRHYNTTERPSGPDKERIFVTIENPQEDERAVEATPGNMQASVIEDPCQAFIRIMTDEVLTFALEKPYTGVD
jgi:hypothetical protein